MKIVKKYSNRKLYVDGGYVTLDDLVRMLRRGEEFRVEAHGTGHDCTNQTLGEAISRWSCCIPLSHLKTLAREISITDKAA